MPSHGGGLGGGVTAPPGFSLTAPELAWDDATDPSSDNTQDVIADITEDIEGYAIRVVGMVDAAIPSSGPYDLDTLEEIDAGEVSAGFEEFSGLTLTPDGLWTLTAWIETYPAGVQVSPRAVEITKTIDTVAPTVTRQTAIYSPIYGGIYMNEFGTRQTPVGGLYLNEGAE